METRLVSLRDLSAADEQAWRGLAERAVEPNPYFEPDFLRPACRHFEGYGQTRLVIAQEGPEFRAVLPIIGVEHPKVPPRPTAVTRGDPTAISGLSTPLVDGACVDRAIGALLDELHVGARRGGLPGIVALSRVGDDGPVATATRRVCAARGLPVFTKDTWLRGTVSRQGAWEHPLTRHRRRDIDRLRRGLTRDTGNEVTLVDRSRDPTAAAEFLEMEASGWKGRGHGSAFARHPAKIAWFREWCELWAPTGRLHLLALHVGEACIAMQCFVRAGRGLFFFRMAFDAAYARSAPGAMLLASSMEHLRTCSDADWIDSCADRDNRFVLEMLPEARPLSMLLIGTGGVVDRRAVSALPAVTRIVAAGRRARRRWARPA